MALQKALLALPEKQRMVFNLKYYQEMKYEEMSDIFGTFRRCLEGFLSPCREENRKVFG